MRVIEPRREKSHEVYRKRSHFRQAVFILLPFIGCVIIASVVFRVYQESESKDDSNRIADTAATGSENSPVIAPEDQNKPFKSFTGQEFKDLYYKVGYPNTQQLAVQPEITGNEVADKRIRSLAEARGYKKTAVPQSSIVRINEPRLSGDDLLQPLAAAGWGKLKDSAKKDAVPLSIVSAYRSPKWQRELFMERLLANGTNPTLVAAGISDDIVNKVLTLAAVPGYSRHHTGYTIDLWCEDGSSSFGFSTCYDWIKKENYLKAKEAGWIPSYPEGTDLQGPEPEPWEFVWVGTAVLREN